MSGVKKSVRVGKRSEWEVDNIVESAHGDAWHFRLTAISTDRSDAHGVQPVTVKTSKKHEHRLICLTCNTNDCAHITHLRRYLHRFGSARAAYLAFHQTKEWIETRRKVQRADYDAHLVDPDYDPPF